MNSDMIKILSEGICDPSEFSSLPENIQAEIMQLGSILQLLRDNSTEAIYALRDAALRSNQDAVNEVIYWSLGLLSSSHPEESGVALYELAVRKHARLAADVFFGKELDPQAVPAKNILSFLFTDWRSPTSNSLLEISRYLLQAGEEIQKIVIAHAEKTVYKNWAITIKAALFSMPANLEDLVEQFEFMTSDERTLAFSILAITDIRSNLYMQDAVCQLFIHFDYRPALNLANDIGFIPGNQIDAALFLFLSENWEAYDRIDLDYRLLTAGYELCKPQIKKRLMAISRSAGRLAWTQQLSAGSRRYWLGDLSDYEWAAAVAFLHKENRLDDLWKLAQVAPPVHSGKILRLLKSHAWSPANPNEIQGYNRLISLAEKLENSPLPVLLRTTWRSPSRELACIGFDKQSNSLAGGTSQTAIYLWKLTEQADQLPALFNPVPRTYALAISPGGEFLAAASADHSIRLFRLHDERLVKTLTGHEGVIRSLVFSPDGKSLHSGSFDRTIRHWRIPEGTTLADPTKLGGEVFNLIFSEDGRFLLSGGTDRCVNIIRSRDMQQSIPSIAHADTLTALSTYGSVCASTARDRTINLLNFTTARQVGQIESENRIVSLAFFQKGNWLISGQLDGDIALWDISTSQIVTKIKFHENAVNGVFTLGDDEGFISSSPNGDFCWWDTIILRACTTIIEDLAGEWRKIESKINGKKYYNQESSWIEMVKELINWKKRHDIEIGEFREIMHAGEFDIQL
jgi:WD40 repeat protein